MAGKLSTHILDIGLGKPASGIQVDLLAVLEGGVKELQCTAYSNAEGRLDAPLSEELVEGIYELQFHVEDYLIQQGNLRTLLWDVIPIRFRVTRDGGHYHIPLLIAPGGYSTYRGS
ncbi:5-hydroxyisourate hydrolase [Paenibacillus sp. DS2015]|uniref:hydroxyisourate hydrolase n=1 Tax=Paenibacillus sp. DS2015 TaxID=3373917 RepID=UPI003D219957